MNFDDLDFEKFKQTIAIERTQGICGHDIERGQVNGYSKKLGSICSRCWSQWKLAREHKDLHEQS